MTKEEVSVLVVKVLDCASERDWENAHKYEKEVWERVLDAIANNDGNAQEIAKEALKTGLIQFPRYFG